MLRSWTNCPWKHVHILLSQRRAHTAHKAQFSKVLVANRGEIACRVMETCRKLDIRTVAVFSDVDRKAKHADEAVYIGAAPPTESYLSASKILSAAKTTGAQAVHPGYGFLSENANFSRLCEEAGVVFIGPPPSAIIAMGSKSESKALMTAAGVPVTPGYHGSDQSYEGLLREANKIGYPLIIKAVYGGGGKGMRLVWKEEDFKDALELHTQDYSYSLRCPLESCQREAKKSFSDESVLLERYVQAPRHVEFQIFCDSLGGAVHLFERDCSVQRRHQKVLEEAPAPHLDSHTHARMADAAVTAAKAVGYRGAGTIEFLLDTESGEFYFCEMNTRLQVEHPVTEMITGLDLVEWQLLVAAGHPLPLTQSQIQRNGHALECRVYAENVPRGFLPATGNLRYLHVGMPQMTHTKARVDSGVREGDDVSMFYDPMIAKLITWGPDRSSALSAMSAALSRFRIAGVPNNVDFLKTCVAHEGFVKGGLTTKFLSEHGADLVKKSICSVEPADVALAAGLLCAHERPYAASGLWAKSNNDWRAVGSRTQAMTVAHAQSDGKMSSGESVHITFQSEGYVQVAVGDLNASLQVDVQRNGSGAGYCFSAVIDGVLRKGTFFAGPVGSESHLELPAISLEVWIEGTGMHMSFVKLADSFAGAGAGAVGGRVMSPMPGKVVRVAVEEGAVVKQGQLIMILEAMKMEHMITAPVNGIVQKVFFSAGDIVQEGAPLAEVQPGV